MRLCLVGNFSGTPDEGMKKISQTLKAKLSINNEVLTFTIKDLLKPVNIQFLREYSPHIIHYLHGPTIRSLVILKLVKFLVRANVKVVVSATKPYFPKSIHWLVPLVLPDLLLTQSQKFEKFFVQFGAKIKFFPNGVDCTKFKSASGAEKTVLRSKFDIPIDKLVVLHVGHIKANRQLGVFKQLQGHESVQVVIVGGTDQVSDKVIKNELINLGIIVIHEYLKDISEIYNAADIYVFPIEDTGEKLPDEYNQVGAIDLPLSVFEAMACNLPIISTRFGALERVFKQGNGFRYVDSGSELISCVGRLNGQEKSGTRKMVLTYDWNKVVAQVEEEYRNLVG